MESHTFVSPPEGGGQFVRFLVALSLVRPLRLSVENIRAGRPKPGIHAQLDDLITTLGLVPGAAPGSLIGQTAVDFQSAEDLTGPLGTPKAPLEIQTRGSTWLVFQALMPALLARGGVVVIKGNPSLFNTLQGPLHVEEILAATGLAGKVRLQSEPRAVRISVDPGAIKGPITVTPPDEGFRTRVVSHQKNKERKQEEEDWRRLVRLPDHGGLDAAVYDNALMLILLFGGSIEIHQELFRTGSDTGEPIDGHVVTMVDLARAMIDQGLATGSVEPLESGTVRVVITRGALPLNSS
jgi:hypothetical protein